MNLVEFVNERKVTFLETREADVIYHREALERAEIWDNRVSWASEDDTLHSYDTLEDLQLAWDMDFDEWVRMCPEYQILTDVEKAKLEDFLDGTTPINVWGDLI